MKSDIPGLLSRTKRNIVPPGWYSIYVTNNYVFKKSPKAKKVSDSTKGKDEVKNIWARARNFPFLRIPYYLTKEQKTVYLRKKLMYFKI